MPGTSELVTINGLNTVWTKGVIPLYEKLNNECVRLDSRLDNIGDVFRFRKSFVQWSDFINYDGDLYPIKKGDVISVDKGYLSYTKDPEDYPEWEQGDPGRLFICITPSDSKPAYTELGDEWETYWTPIDLNLQVASNSQYGIVKLASSSSSDTPNTKYVKDSNGLYVNVPYATHKNNNAQGTVGVLSVGNGLKLNNNEVSLELASSDPGLFLSDDGVLANTGIKSLSNVVPAGTPTPLTGNLKVEKAVSQDGAIKFSSDGGGNPSYEVPVKGWDTKQDKETAVTHTASIAVGSECQPIYVKSDGQADKITTLKLGDLTAQELNSNLILHIKKGNDGQTYPTAAIIDGGSKTDSDPGYGETGVLDVALWVKGRLSVSNCISASKVYHAVWNDISDAIEVQDDLKTDPGYCYFFDGTEYHRTTRYCQKGIIGIHSDTAGSVLGRKGKHKELDISVGGFVLAYVDKYYEPGTPLTSAPDGKLTKMSLWSRVFHSERLVATYWKPEMEAEWGDDTHTVEVNGRHWVKVR